ncbi:pickpocket protein 28-like isoform X1 [Euwallacea similis]|uniref:pickpocket protein 28-like isoform X1 n=1 Tax=Euwallacea similis TaxID=1736056 RepID=UPI00344F5C53
MDHTDQSNLGFHRYSIQDGNMADIKSNKKKLVNARNYFREYCDYTGIHGFKFIGERRSLCEKASWTIVFCVSLIACIGVVYEVFKKWQKSNIIVNFASEQVNIFDITFPAVTICPETKVHSDHFNYSFSLRRNLNESIPENELKKLQYMSLLCNVNIHYNRTPKVDTIDEEFYEFLKNGTPPFFTRCLFMGREYKKCSEIFQPLFTDEGLCHTFNMLSTRQLFTNNTANIKPPPKDYNDSMATKWSADHGYSENAGIHTYPRRALLSGTVNSLEVNLSVNNTDIDYGCTHYQGYKVVLHSPHRFPTVSNHYFRIPLRKSVSAAITPVQLKTSEDLAQYSSKKRTCFFQTDMKLKYFSKYSQLNCRLECFLNLTMESCGCVEYFMPRETNMPICGTGKYECIKNASVQLAFLSLKGYLHENMKEKEKERMKQYLGKEGDTLSRHFCYCPEMCNTIDYNVEITESDYDWPRKMAALGIDVTEDDEGLSSSQLLIYFKSSTFIPQERNELFGTFDFLANVGGLLGLFVGFSLLSMVELIYFLSLRIICNLKLYKSWYGKPEVKPNNIGTILNKTSSLNLP